MTKNKVVRIFDDNRKQILRAVQNPEWISNTYGITSSELLDELDACVIVIDVLEGRDSSPEDIKKGIDALRKSNKAMEDLLSLLWTVVSAAGIFGLYKLPKVIFTTLKTKRISAATNIAIKELYSALKEI